MNSEESKPLLKKKKIQYSGVVVKSDREDLACTEEKEKTSEESAGWSVVAASFLCIFVLAGTMYSFGVFLEPLISDLHQSKGLVSTTGSLQVALSASIAPVAGIMVRNVGARTVCHTGAVTASFGLLLASFASKMVGIFGGLSLLTGIGFGLMYISAVVVVAETFTTRMSLAVSISLCGAWAGQLGMSPVVSWVVEMWGWRRGLQVLSVMTLSCVMLTWAMRKKTNLSRVDIQTSDAKDRRQEEVTKRPLLARVVGESIAGQEHVYIFLVMVLADSLAVMALCIPYRYLTPVAEATGISSELSALLIKAIGIGSVSGCILSGWLSDQTWCHPLFLIRAVVSISCCLPFLLSWVDHFWMFIGLSITFGFMTGQWIAATIPLLVSLLGIGQIGQAFGLLTAVRGLAFFFSPPLAEMLLNLNSNPVIALYLSGILLMVSGAIFTLAVFMHKRKIKMNVMYQEI